MNYTEGGQSNADFAWQIKFMDQYDAAQQESKKRLDMLAQSQLISRQKQARIDELQTDVSNANVKLTKLKAKTKARNSLIREKFDALNAKYEKRNRLSQQKISEQQNEINKVKERVQRRDKAIQKMKETHKNTITADQILSSLRVIRETHSYALPYPGYRPTPFYQCHNCDKIYNKKSTYDDHVAEFCIESGDKDMKCPICPKMFTCRGLRLHLNHFATGKHKATKQHSKYTPQQHQILCNLLKEVTHNKN